jgi:hypothetical protein
MSLPAFALLAAVIASPSPPPGTQLPMTAITFTDPIRWLESRIAEDQQRKLLAPGQDVLLRVQLDTARKASVAHDPAANDMFDVIDRQLADVDHILTLAEEGRGITIHVGDTVIVAMHDQYIWKIENSDATVLPPKIGVMWIRGVQGGFTAKQPGTAILSLTTRSNAPPNVKQPVVFAITILPAKGP